MSFILEDKDLINQLLASGLDFQLKFTKKGQEAATAVEQDRVSLLNHLKDMQSELRPDPNAGPQISHEGDDAARPGLTASNMESLGDFVKWLSDNKITISGKRIAYDTDPNDDAYTPYPLETHLADPQQRGSSPSKIYASPILLKQYLISLQAYEQKQPFRPFQVQLNTLIQDANKELGLGINSKYQSPDKVLRDDELLDTVPSKFVNVASSGYGGDVPLTYGDVKTDIAFNKWLSDHSIAFRAMVDNKLSFVYFGHPSFNRCAILNILKYRADRKMGTDANSKEAATFYVRQIISIARETNCQLTNQTETDNSEGSGNNQQNGQGQNQSGIITGEQAINEAVQTLPFASRDINFDRIRSFFKMVSVALNNDPKISGLISQTLNLMDSVNAKMSTGDIFPMGVRPYQFKETLKNNSSAKDYYDVLKTLSQIINNTRHVVEFFWYLKGKSPNYRSAFVGQIGETPNDDSLYNQNAQSLQDLYGAKQQYGNAK